MSPYDLVALCPTTESSRAKVLAACRASSAASRRCKTLHFRKDANRDTAAHRASTIPEYSCPEGFLSWAFHWKHKSEFSSGNRKLCGFDEGGNAFYGTTLEYLERISQDAKRRKSYRINDVAGNF